MKSVSLYLAPTALLILLLLAGCTSVMPGTCHKQKRTGAERDAALAGNLAGAHGRKFQQETMTVGGRQFTVIIPPASQGKHGRVRRDWKAIVLCPELPTVGASILELAQRLAEQGYAVYIPVLWGDLQEEPSGWLGVRRGAAFAFGYPEWQAARTVDQRPIVGQLAALCEQIAHRHGKQRIGVIGLCLTGSFPVELLGEKTRLPIGAAVVSQPSLPLLALSTRQKASPGFSPEKLARIANRAREDNVWVIGFRFELDKISPPERFVTLQRAFKNRFLDRTLPASGYVGDGCAANAHAVLTDGFKPWYPGTRETHGHLAWRRLVWFLDRRLKGRSLPEPQLGEVSKPPDGC